MENKNRSNLTSKLAGLMILSALTKIFGFLREIILASQFGAGEVTDAYKIIYLIPNVVLIFIGTGISTGFIPIYTRLQKEKGNDGADSFMSNVINISVIIGLIISILIFLFPEQVIKLFAYGFTQDNRMEIAKLLLRGSILSVIPSIILFCLPSYLQIFGRFYSPIVATIPMNLIYIASYYYSRSHGFVYLGYGMALAIVVQLLFLIPFVVKAGYRWTGKVDFKEPDFRYLLALAAPVTLGVAVQQINTIVDKNMASSIISGGVSALDYSNKLLFAVFTIVIVSTVSILYPEISKKFIDMDMKGFSRTVRNTLVILSLIIIPCTVGFMVFSQPIIELVYKRGSFGNNEVLLSSGALFFYALELPPLAFREVFNRVFYSMNDTKTPTINSTIAVVINIILNIILSRFMGINGLALATSISLLISTILLIRAIIVKSNVSIFDQDIIISFIKIMIASLVMAIVSLTFFRMNILGLSSKALLLVTIILAGIIYGLIVLFSGIPQIKMILHMIGEKLHIVKKDDSMNI